MQDLVDQHLRDNKEHAAMQEVMGGTFAQQIICKSIPHRSEKDEEFYQATTTALCSFHYEKYHEHNLTE